MAFAYSSRSASKPLRRRTLFLCVSLIRVESWLSRRALRACSSFLPSGPTPEPAERPIDSARWSASDSLARTRRAANSWLPAHNHTVSLRNLLMIQPARVSLLAFRAFGRGLRPLYTKQSDCGQSVRAGRFVRGGRRSRHGGSILSIRTHRRSGYGLSRPMSPMRRHA